MIDRGYPTSKRDPIRAIGQVIDAVCGPYPVVLLDGAPLSGVSRRICEAAVNLPPDSRVIIGKAAELHRIVDSLKAGEPLRGSDLYVVVLDDLSPADLVLLGAEVLEAIIPHATVLAGINSELLERILADRSPITGAARTAVLEYGWRISMPFAMTPLERAMIRVNHPDLKPGPSIAATMVGGEGLLERYVGADPQHRDGQLLVQAAVDARRCGVHRSLSETELYHLFAARVDDDGSDLDERFAMALEWACTTPPHAGCGLLFRAAGEDEGWKVLSYLAAADDGFRRHPVRAIPDLAWPAALAALSPADAYAIGISAHLYGRQREAVVAFQRAAAEDQGPAINTAATAALAHIS
ncbi:hypothetical protein [Nocardia sp. NBC_00403]|uniref:hypothetical protein n=1 Tax=Nocardia sp. NBC_00403 TaxID=2975990 RepID=UPI002E246AE4